MPIDIRIVAYGLGYQECKEYFLAVDNNIFMLTVRPSIFIVVDTYKYCNEHSQLWTLMLKIYHVALTKRTVTDLRLKFYAIRYIAMSKGDCFAVFMPYL